MLKISGRDSSCKYLVMSAVLNLIENDLHPPVFLCIGSNSVSGDMLGPKIGELLRNKYNLKAFVYGTLNRPVNSENIASTHNFIRKNHPFSKIFAIDASLGGDAEKGIISIYRGPLLPGAALKKDIPPVGDYSITANVSTVSCENIISLSTVRMDFVHELAEKIAFGINDAMSVSKACKLKKYQTEYIC